jgi:hypothetical protein
VGKGALNRVYLSRIDPPKASHAASFARVVFIRLSSCF